MDDTTKTILIASASGTIGAAITQICSLINNYYSDQRKYQSEQNKVVVLRKIEIGERAIHHIGITIQMFQKVTNYLESDHQLTSQKAYDSFNEFLNQQLEEVKRSELENSLMNFIPIYFKVKTSFKGSAIDDSKTKLLDIEYMELLAKIVSDPVNKALYVNELSLNTKKTIDHYKSIIKTLELDYDVIIKDVHKIISKIN